MKSVYFKYFFVIFAVLIMIFAIIKIKTDEKIKNTKVENQVETQEINTDSELKLGIASFDSINPILSKNKNVQDISKLIFEPLFTLSSDYKLENCLAKEWARQDDTTYLIKLNDNVKWSDGSEFTAEDVKFTIDSIKSNDSIYKSNVEHIYSVEVVDNSMVRITLDQKVPFFEYNLTFPILSSQYYSDKEFSADIVPLGTGLYKVGEVQTSSLILEKNEYNSNSNDLKISKITITIYASLGELYNGFKTGSVDIISTQNSSLKEYIGTIGYNSKEIKGRVHDFIAFNTQNPMLSQLSVRRAICYSIDKTNVVASVYGENYYTSSFPLDYGNWVYQGKDASIGYNLDQAKRILLDDGWTYSYRHWQKYVNYQRQRLILNFVIKSDDENQVKVGENIKAQLENQGIRINLIKANSALYQTYLNNKNYDMILCSMNLSVSPDLSTFFGENNLANYSNDEVTNILNDIYNTTDENKIKESYDRLGEIYKTDLPYLSLYNNKYIVAYSSSLVGTVDPNWFYLYYNIKDWHK